MKRTHSLSGRYRTAGVSAGMQMTPETICAYISEMERKGRVQGTIEEYKRNLRLLYDFLPDHKRIKKDTLQRWRDSLLEQGYTARTANARVSAANSSLAFCGRRDLQLAHQLETEAYAQPELTRNEYLRLLQTARVLGKERLYLLIKLFGCTGIAVQNIERVTVEAVKAGEIPAGLLQQPPGDIAWAAQGKADDSGFRVHLGILNFRLDQQTVQGRRRGILGKHLEKGNSHV